jgi:hypothetical protein
MKECNTRPHPILIKENSVFIENLKVAAEEYACWGFYCQGYGSYYKDLMDRTAYPRETKFEELGGFQTMPINWGINTPIIRRFFDAVRRIARGE